MSDTAEHQGSEGGSSSGWRGLLGPHLLTLVATAAVAFVLLIPIPDTGLDFGEGLPYSDKLMHFVLFFGWAAAARRSLRALRVPSADLWVVLLALALGAALEVLQGAGPYREPEFLDGIADALGALVYVVLARFLGRHR